MHRMLLYSLDKNRPIRLIFLTLDGGMRQVTAVVECLDDTSAQLYILRPPQRLTLPLTDILSADFTRKDDGQ